MEQAAFTKDLKWKQTRESRETQKEVERERVSNRRERVTKRVWKKVGKKHHMKYMNMNFKYKKGHFKSHVLF